MALGTIMHENKSKIRTWLESRITGKLEDPQWLKIRGRYSNQQLRSMTRERLKVFLNEVK
uniref:Uncharacterized protein n=1 Tax=viral metagenome TaxID=1070528 RepID=A0A6M3JV99_9ZZZZ